MNAASAAPGGATPSTTPTRRDSATMRGRAGTQHRDDKHLLASMMMVDERACEDPIAGHGIVTGCDEDLDANVVGAGVEVRGHR